MALFGIISTLSALAVYGTALKDHFSLLSGLSTEASLGVPLQQRTGVRGFLPGVGSHWRFTVGVVLLKDRKKVDARGKGGEARGECSLSYI